MQKAYTVKLEKRVVKKDLPLIPVRYQVKILQRIHELKTEQYPSGYKKLGDYDPVTYRIRQGVYRILYRVDSVNQIVTIIKVRHRSTAYKDN